MYVIASFEQSICLELALSAIEEAGLAREQILAVPLDRRTEPRTLFDTIHRADGLSLFDLAAVLGTCGMLLGAVYGFIWTWGPILWGLIGLAAGILAGFVVKLLVVRGQVRPPATRGTTAEVFVLIHCREDQAQTVERILWDNLALGVGKLYA
ncbi:MAG: hypothetical protein K6T30_06500 [Alicyclobacillus sp.]|nr:hypothetical protein [Alicyclobacillus sp.]